MPRKKTEPAEQTPKKTARSREVKTKPEEAKKNATKSEGKTQPKKPRAKKATAKEKKVEAVEAELVQEKGGVGVNGNLIPLSQRSKKVQREIQEKGRQKNKENWQKKKEQREIFNDILDMAVSGKIKENLEFLGISPEYMTWNVAMYVSLMVDAVNKHNINAFRTAMEYAGRAPLQEIRENEAIAKMSQAIMLAQGTDDENEQTDEDVVFYIPENGRTIVRDDGAATV